MNKPWEHAKWKRHKATYFVISLYVMSRIGKSGEK